MVAAEAAGADVCAAANDNGGEQVVLSGDKAAVERAVEIAKTRGAKRAMLLPVSAPFHCALMQPAADAMADALAKVAVKPPSVPLVANVLAQPISDPAIIVRSLVAQVTGTVRWRESVLFMAQAGVTTFYEVGAGKVLTGLIKRIAPGANASAIGTPDDVTKFKATRERLKRTRCSISPEKPPWSRERPAPSAAASPASFMGKARHWRSPARALTRSMRSPANSAAAPMSLPCNLADAAAVDALVASAEEAMGQLDVLVANAGVTRDNLLVQLRDEDWEQVIAINLTATFRLTRAAVRGMMRRRFGRIIAITSVVGTTGNPGQANYVAAKAGIAGMIKATAQEYAKRGVTANCVAPGFIVTPMTDKLNDKQRDVILAKVPANRAGTPEEVAAAVVFLASNEAAYVTGQTLHVNGGMVMI